MKREQLLQKIGQNQTWDIVVIGGGASGLGVTLDATLRGFKTLLIEQHDFTKGTSSKSTKLVHGGVRYLAQGDVGLVIEALRERGLMLRNAPHLVKDQTFIIPNYAWWRGQFYTIGMMMYDLLAGKLSFGRSHYIGKKKVIDRIPTIRQNGLKSGVVYHDGQFDDSRLAVHLVRSILENGGTAINYIAATSLIKENGQITGVVAEDKETGKKYNIAAKTVVNAAGVFVNDVIKMDNPDAPNLIRPSQGVHIVVDKEFLPGNDALMIPKTDDGRVLFAVPWHNKIVVGTTDTPVTTPVLEPRALEEEVEFILRTAGRYLEKPVRREDVRSIFAGLRPLAAPRKEGDKKTREISRNHKIIVSDSGLITITGGKWTTYRKMAQDVVDKVVRRISAGAESSCTTETFKIHGYKENVDRSNPRYVYGSDLPELETLCSERPEWKEPLHERLPYWKGEVVWAARFELAQTIEDVLARRLRALLLDARAAMDAAPFVADVLAAELQKDDVWKKRQIEEFTEQAKGYILV